MERSPRMAAAMPSNAGKAPAYSLRLGGRFVTPVRARPVP